MYCVQSNNDKGREPLSIDHRLIRTVSYYRNTPYTYTILIVCANLRNFPLFFHFLFHSCDNIIIVWNVCGGLEFSCFTITLLLIQVDSQTGNFVEFGRFGSIK